MIDNIPDIVELSGEPIKDENIVNNKTPTHTLN